MGTERRNTAKVSRWRWSCQDSKKVAEGLLSIPQQAEDLLDLLPADTHQERVVAAVKRLSKTYFMLDKSKMLGATSDLVTQHIMQGREASDVIDELEQVFIDQYQRLKEVGKD